MRVYPTMPSASWCLYHWQGKWGLRPYAGDNSTATSTDRASAATLSAAWQRILMCAAEICSTFESIKNWMGPYQLTPKKVTRAIRYPGLGALDWRICWCLGSRSLQCDMSMCSQDGQSPAAVRQWDVWGKTRCDIGFCKQSWLQISLDVTLHFQAVWDSWDALLSFWGFKLVTHSLVLTSMKFHNEMFKITLLF